MTFLLLLCVPNQLLLSLATQHYHFSIPLESKRVVRKGVEILTYTFSDGESFLVETMVDTNPKYYSTSYLSKQSFKFAGKQNICETRVSSVFTFNGVKIHQDELIFKPHARTTKLDSSTLPRP
jgi:hypothetical protein